MAKKKDIRSVIALMKSKGYAVYTQPYQLNIVGIRSKDGNPKEFNDWLYVFWKNSNNILEFRNYKITTDPSINYLKNPIDSSGGTAILKEGQYKSYGLGYHKGQYKALVQIKPVTIYRDLNRDSLYDFGKSVHTGMFGINIHRASASGTTQYIQDYSAGCQVFQNANEFKNFIFLCEIHESKYGNNFTYTLIDEWQMAIHKKKILFIAILVIIVVGIIILVFRKRIFILFSKSKSLTL